MNRITQVLFFCTLCLLSSAVAAGWIEPGDPITLAPNEGLALFVVDNDGSLSNVRIDKIGSIFSSPVLKKLTSGRDLRLLKLEQGEYQFDQAQLSVGWTTYAWEFKDLPNRRFHVEAGKLNYIGDLKVVGWLFVRQMSIRNGGLRVFDELEAQFPGLGYRFEWRYAGEFPDPFIEFYKRQLSGRRDLQNAGDPVLTRPSLQQKDLASLLFRAGLVQKVELSPSGRYILEYRTEGNASNIYLLDLEAKKNRLLFSSSEPPISAKWLNPAFLTLTYRKGGVYRSNVFEIKSVDLIETTEIPARGNIFSARANGSARVIYQRENQDNYGMELFDVELSTLEQARKLNDRQLSKNKQLRTEVKNDNAWLVDAAGVPRLAQIQVANKSSFTYFASATSSGVKFELEERETDPNDQFSFVGFDRDGRLLAISNRGRPQAELIEFDPVAVEEGASRFSRPGVDVLGAMYGLYGEVVGVRIMSSGRIQQEMFDGAEGQLQRSIEAALPDRTVRVDSARDNGNRLVISFGPKDPGSYYLYNDQAKSLELVALASEHLEDRPMLDTRRFEVTGHDGFVVEAFLTEPESAGSGSRPPPLLVMPHGGPIGVFDTKRFDPKVQYFSQLGFAVVQVNYRGSGGAGSVTTNLGLGQFGRAIEADVDAVVEHLVSAGMVDADRIVAMGTSYGGYSALMLALQKPERYKAAVSIAGVTDIPAQFSGGDVAASRHASDQLLRIIGDPRKDVATLQNLSPVYRYEEFSRPIMLVHDRGDERVTLDQSERLRRLLMLRGTPASTIFVQDDAHGITTPATAIDVYPKIAAFLFQVLSASPDPAPDSKRLDLGTN